MIFCKIFEKIERSKWDNITKNDNYDIKHKLLVKNWIAKSQNGEEKSKWNTWLWLFYFLGAFCFPHCEALARPQNGDSHSGRYDNSAIRRTNREAGAKGNCGREEEKKEEKRKRILEAESSRELSTLKAFHL